MMQSGGKAHGIELKLQQRPFWEGVMQQQRVGKSVVLRRMRAHRTRLFVARRERGSRRKLKTQSTPEQEKVRRSPLLKQHAAYRSTLPFHLMFCSPWGRIGRRARAVRIVGRTPTAVGASHPIESLDRVWTVRTMQCPPVPLIYLKMEGEIGHTLLLPLGTHLSWLLWGRSRSASFLRGHETNGRRARAVRAPCGRRADTPSYP